MKQLKRFKIMQMMKFFPKGESEGIKVIITSNLKKIKFKKENPILIS